MMNYNLNVSSKLEEVGENTDADDRQEISTTVPATTTTSTSVPAEMKGVNERSPRSSSLPTNGNGNSNTYAPARTPQTGLSQQTIEEASPPPSLHNQKLRPSSGTDQHPQSPVSSAGSHSRTESTRSNSSTTAPDSVSSRKTSTGNTAVAALKGFGWKKHKQSESDTSGTYPDGNQTSLNTPPESPIAGSRKISYGRKLRNMSSGSTSETVSQMVAEGIKTVPNSSKHFTDSGTQNCRITSTDYTMQENEFGGPLYANEDSEKDSTRKVSLGKTVNWMKRGRITSKN